MTKFRNIFIAFLLIFCGISGNARSNEGELQQQIDALIKKADIYFARGDFQAAIESGIEALYHQFELTGEYDLKTGKVIDKLAGYYFQNQNWKEALELYKSLRAIQERHQSPDLDKEYSITLGNIAKCKNNLGLHEEALDAAEKIIEFRRKRFGDDSLLYGNALADKSTFLYAAGDVEQAIKYCKEALKIIDSCIGKNNQFYIPALNNLLLYNLILERYEDAVKESESLLPLIVSFFGNRHPFYLRALNNKAFAWSLNGDKDEAAQAYNEIANLLKENYSRQNPDYIQALQALTIDYLPTLDGAKITSTAMECSELLTEFVRESFTTLTAEERANFWKQHQPWYQEILPMIVELYPTEGLLRQLYDATLFSKGLLLNSETELKNIIMNEADEETVELFNKFMEAKEVLSELYEIPIDRRPVSVEEMRELVYQFENRLLMQSMAFGDFTKNFTISWEDVKANLGKDDLAVEFINHTDEQGVEEYSALLLRKDYPSPRMVHLFYEPQLSGIGNDKIYTTTLVSELVWNNLRDELDKADNIYFSPAGQLYNLAIESLPLDTVSRAYMSDRYKLTRLSSTRQLALKKDRPVLVNADIYGGLKYDTDATRLEADNRKYSNRTTRGENLEIDPQELGLRGKVDYLPGTKTEADNITSTLQAGEISARLFTGDEGTEASLKDLSGKEVNLLHLATHGFFWNERKAKSHTYLKFISNGNPQTEEDKMLSRSGLLLSGANNVLSRKVLPDGVEDGILTASEISRLDFRNLDLVVLSACQTGLGVIKGDGVFGLQRGFKKAGANTIVMSLWSVPDKPTQLLMSRFYDNLLAHRNKATGRNYSKREALQEAQRFVRDYEETDENGNLITPYSSPENWAAFIILDAV